MSTMGLRQILRMPLASLASFAPVRVFLLTGENAPVDPELLNLRDDLILLDSPRSATVLLIAGALSESLFEPAKHIHDQMAHPRCTVWWVNADTSSAENGQTLSLVPDPLIVSVNTSVLPASVSDESDDESDGLRNTETNAKSNANTNDALVALVSALKRTQYELVTGTRASELDICPDVDPAPWRGVGPYAQGGTGMTGGVPYGRPLTERAPDRDSLELDQLPLRVGPFFHSFPQGFVLDVELQGDIVQSALVSAGPVMRLPAMFAMALVKPVPIVVIERERARSHLHWLSHALRAHGLTSLARRTLRLSLELSSGHASMTDCAGELRIIARGVERSQVLWWSTRGVGVMRAPTVVTALGPIARASGICDDARIDEPSYRALGFEPITQSVATSAAGGDSSARWRQRIAEVAQSLDLAERARGARAWGSSVVEGTRGRTTQTEQPETRLYALLPDLLQGLEWSDAVTAIVSLDLGEGGKVRRVLPWAAKNKAAEAPGAMNMGQMDHGM